MRSCVRLVLALALGSSLWAQIGVHIPHRRKPNFDPNAVPTEISGTLRSISAAEIVVTAADARVITAKRDEKTTKFFKEDKEAKPTDFHPGDQIRIEASDDTAGHYHALKVIWVKAAAAPPPAKPEEPPQSAKKPAEEPNEPSARMAGPAVTPDEDDPGPPELKRGIPPVRRAGTSPDGRIVMPADAPLQAEAPPEKPPEPKPEDPLILKARAAAASFTEKLPNYLCKQFTTRYQSDQTPVNWRPLDVITAEVAYEDGREHYRDIKIGGKATNKRMEDLSGSWSTGEFGTTLADIFSPASAATFYPRRSETIAGVQTEVYDLEVAQPNSHWTVIAPAQRFRPAYRGTVWLDKTNGRVMRIEMQARKIPEEFPFDTAELTVDYEYVRLGAIGRYLLPVRAEHLVCQRGSSLCTRNVIEFRTYHVFEGESTLKY